MAQTSIAIPQRLLCDDFGRHPPWPRQGCSIRGPFIVHHLVHVSCIVSVNPSPTRAHNTSADVYGMPCVSTINPDHLLLSLASGEVTYRQAVRVYLAQSSHADKTTFLSGLVQAMSRAMWVSCQLVKCTKRSLRSHLTEWARQHLRATTKFRCDTSFCFPWDYWLRLPKTANRLFSTQEWWLTWWMYSERKFPTVTSLLSLLQATDGVSQTPFKSVVYLDFWMDELHLTR